MKDSKKKLLILGGAPNETTLVKRAQELGFYVIVADYYTDLKLSPGKSFCRRSVECKLDRCRFDDSTLLR